MSFKSAVRKAAKLVLASSPEQHASVSVGTIFPGSMLAGRRIVVTDCASGRVFLPEEFAKVALFLPSDAPNCVSGEAIRTNADSHLSVWWDER